VTAVLWDGSAKADIMFTHFVEFMNAVDLPWNTICIYDHDGFLCPFAYVLRHGHWQFVNFILRAAPLVFTNTEVFQQSVRALFSFRSPQAAMAWRLLSPHLSRELIDEAVAMMNDFFGSQHTHYDDILLEQCLESNGEFVDLFKYRAWTLDVAERGRKIQLDRLKRRETICQTLVKIFSHQRFTGIHQIVAGYDLTDNMKWDRQPFPSIHTHPLLTHEQYDVFHKFAERYPARCASVWVLFANGCEASDGHITKERAFESFTTSTMRGIGQTEPDIMFPHFVQFMNAVGLPWNTKCISKHNTLWCPLAYVIHAGDWQFVYAILRMVPLTFENTEVFSQTLRTLFFYNGNLSATAWLLLSHHLSQELIGAAVTMMNDFFGPQHTHYDDILLEQCLESNGEFVDLFKYRQRSDSVGHRAYKIRTERHQRREEICTLLSSIFLQRRVTEISQLVTSYDLTDNMKWDTLS